jgi:hypothetical protein
LCTNNGGGAGPLLQAATTLQRRAATFAPGALVGTGVYLETGQVRQALLVCVLGPPAVVAGKVLAEWVKLLAPPRRWRRPEDAASETPDALDEQDESHEEDKLAS